MGIQNYLSEMRDAVDGAVRDLLHEYEEKIPLRLFKAIEYSLTAGGKRLRPILLLSSFSLYRDDWKSALPYGVSIECVHTYSLIHDDLPAMDDDDYRRGVPTCHRTFGEDVAILAGDALLTEAFRILLVDRDDGIVPYSKIAAARELAWAAGAEGMVGGQILDLEATGRKITEGEVIKIHSLKTGALIRASILAGAHLGGAAAEDISLLSEYGKNVGLAFQIVDDILDVTSSFSEMGKKTGKDLDMGKATYPSVVGTVKARKEAESLVGKAKNSLSSFGEKGTFLAGVADLCLTRRN